jgi:hypothetical protein
MEYAIPFARGSNMHRRNLLKGAAGLALQTLFFRGGLLRAGVKFAPQDAPAREIRHGRPPQVGTSSIKTSAAN